MVAGAVVVEPQKIRYKRPWLYLKQRQAIFNESRFSWIEASTKTGKTQGCISWLFEQALFGQDGYNYWWIAPVSAQADIAFRRMKRGIPQWFYRDNKSLKTITLNTGATIWFKSGDNPDSLYGEDVYAAVVDEASRTKDEVRNAVRTVLTATRGKARYIGNVKGRKNWFFNGCRKAESGLPGHEYHKLIAYDAVTAGILDKEEVEEARRDLPKAVFDELYLAIPTEDGSNPFGIGAIKACIQKRPSKAAPFCWGWDLAKSVDWTVGIGLDEDGNVVELVRFQKPWPETIRTIIEITGGLPAMIDSTGVGDPVLESLQRPGGEDYVVNDNFEGFKFTAPSKQQLMEGLAVGIQKNEIGLIDGVLVIELEQFEYEHTSRGVRYSAPEGMHDDCVCALALAWRNYKEPKPYIIVA